MNSDDSDEQSQFVDASKPAKDEAAGATQPTSVELRASLTYRGPTPPPAWLERYEQIVPGSAERMINVAIKASNARIEGASKSNESEIQLKKRAQIFGFAIAVVALVFGFVLAVRGDSVEGFALIVIGAASVVGTFVANAWSRIRRQQTIDKLAQFLDQE